MVVTEILTLISDLIQATSEHQSTDENCTEDELFELSLHGNMKKVHTRFKSLVLGNSSLQEVSQTVEGTHQMRCHFSTEDNEADTIPTNFDVRWEFVKCNLYLLLCLRESIDLEMAAYKITMADQQSKESTKPEHTAPPLSPDTLSFDQQKWVLTSVQFIACLGICPCLQAGVGVPVQLRSGLGHVLQWSQKPDSLTAQQKDFRLWKCVRILIKCSAQPSLGGLILSCYLGDVVAALMQLCYGPKKPVTPKNTDKTEAAPLEKNMKDLTIDEKAEPSNGISNGVAAEQKTAKPLTQDKPVEEAESEQDILAKTADVLSEEEYEDAALELEHLVKRVFQPVLVRELLMLQGGATAPKPLDKQTGKPAPRSTRAPVWLRKACSQMLTGVLLRANGVKNVLQGMLDRSPAGSEGDEMEWKKIETVSRIIGTCPSYVESKEEFYQTVAPQTLKLLRIDDKLRAARYQQVASCTLGLVWRNDRQNAEKYYIDPLLAPLILCLDDRDLPAVAEPMILATETDICRCLTDLTKVFSIDRAISAELLEILNPVLHTLFRIYCRVLDGILSTRKPVEYLLAMYVKHSPEAIPALNYFITENNSESPQYKKMSGRVVLTPGGEGGIAALLTQQDSTSEVLDGWETTPEAIMFILKKVNNTETTADLFICCLKHLTNIVSGEIQDETEGNTDETKSNTTLKFADPQDKICKLRISLIVLTLLGTMCDVFGPSCLKSAPHILEFVKATLDRCIRVLDNTADIAMGTFEGETVTMALGLLSSVFSGEVEMTSDDREQSKSLLPMLERVKESYPDPLVKQLATDLSVVIATHGMVIPETLGSKTPQDLNEILNGGNTKKEKSTKRKKPLVEVISSKEENSSRNPEKTSTNGHKISSFQETMELLKDKDIPVQGHVLIALRRLLEAKDAETLKQKEKVLEIFRQNISHRDSYIYLAAVEGLATMANLDADGILPILIEEFVGPSGKAKGKRSKKVKDFRSAEVRMKIGEVLVKTSKSLGEMAPKYRDSLLRGFLHGTKDEDSHIRASSVSNLGEICRLLRYSLGSHINEILECITALLRTDPEVEVRRASAMFTTFLLRGLGKDVISVLESSLRDLYRLIKLRVKVEKDSTTLLHLQMSLEELAITMKDFVFPKQTLEKKIHVLDPP